MRCRSFVRQACAHARAFLFRHLLLPMLVASAVAIAVPARADLVVSTAATQNVSCYDNACRATAPNAVLNVTQLENMLATGATVIVEAGGPEKDINLAAAMSWASTGVLKLSALRSVVVNSQIAVTGQGGVSVHTVGGELSFAPGASISFWDLKSTLMLNGFNYTLVRHLRDLSAMVSANPAGHYALARNYDAKADGTYPASPIPATLSGAFEGLGHRITGLSILDQQGSPYGVALFSLIGASGRVADLDLVNAKVDGPADGVTPYVALLADQNEGTIDGVFVSGTATGGLFNTGGLVADNGGTISNSRVDVRVTASPAAPGPMVGAVAAVNEGIISKCFAEGSVMTAPAGEYTDNGQAGGLVGLNTGLIQDSYSLVSVVENRNGGSFYGGLIGFSEGSVVSSYAAGKLGHRRLGGGAIVGGVTGIQELQKRTYRDTYWDRDLGVHDPHQGVGNVPDYPGLTGLTTAQLQAGLPAGFDPRVWQETAGVNGGLPYLRSNPPAQ